MLYMGKKKKSDRHVMKGRLLRMKESVWDALEQLAELLGSDVTHEIRTAVRERLQRHELWPKPQERPASDGN